MFVFSFFAIADGRRSRLFALLFPGAVFRLVHHRSARLLKEYLQWRFVPCGRDIGQGLTVLTATGSHRICTCFPQHAVSPATSVPHPSRICKRRFKYSVFTALSNDRFSLGQQTLPPLFLCFPLRGKIFHSCRGSASPARAAGAHPFLLREERMQRRAFKGAFSAAPSHGAIKFGETRRPHSLSAACAACSHGAADGTDIRRYRAVPTPNDKGLCPLTPIYR